MNFNYAYFSNGERVIGLTNYAYALFCGVLRYANRGGDDAFFSCKAFNDDVLSRSISIIVRGFYMVG